MNCSPSQLQLSLAAALLFPAVACAQDAFQARWDALYNRQPEAIKFSISAAKTTFYAGELIALHVSLSSSQPETYKVSRRLQDRVGRLNGIDEFLVDSPFLVDDPLHGLQGETGAMGGISSSDAVLSSQTFAFEKLLNEWVRFRKPGLYRIAVLTRRVSKVHESRNENPLELVSNVLTIDIAPAPEAWARERLTESVAALNAPALLTEESRLARLHAAQTLRFLDTPDAAAELTRHLYPDYSPEWGSMRLGILGSPYRKQLLPLLATRLVAPEQPVSDYYLDTLVTLDRLVESNGPTGKDVYRSRLASSLASKQPDARAVSLTTLLNGLGDTDPPWLPAVVDSLIADFHQLSPQTQSNLLEARWNLLRTPAMLPALREIYSHPPEPRVSPRLQDTAARKIYDIAPAEGRRILLAEIAKPDSYLETSTLKSLPDRYLPELNDNFAARLEAGQSADALIVRYATGDITQRVERAYEARNNELDAQKLPHCGGPLIFYFLQHDEAYGERELRKQMDQPAPFPICYDIGSQFYTLDGTAYSPALERLAIEFLGSPKVPVKRGAADLLGRYGSPAAQKPLWEAFEFFQSWWKGREKQLQEPQGAEGQQLERSLRAALALADGWLMQSDDFTRLLDLCVSPSCKVEAAQWRELAVTPPPVRIGGWQGQFAVSIGQYQTNSMEQLRQKLKQYPAGTSFRMPDPAANRRVREEVERMFRSEGYALSSQR